MLIDLLNQENYLSFNIDLARLFGLSQAVYLSELISINGKAINKDKIENNFFIVDRNYIEKRTTISVETQIEYDKCFSKINLVEIGDNDNTIKIDLTILTGLAMSDDESLYKDVGSMINGKKKRKTKKDASIDRCDGLITTTNQELKNAYHDWIVSATDKRGLMSNAAVITAQKVVDGYSNRNLDVALEIINIATVNGWADMTWAVNSYERNKKTFNKPSYHIVTSNTSIDKSIDVSSEEF